MRKHSAKAVSSGFWESHQQNHTMADTKDGSISEDEANTLNKDGETQPKKVDYTIKSTPSGSGIIKTFINPLLPGLTLTDSSGRRTCSKSAVGVPASLVCKVNSQYVRLKKMERIAKYVTEKKDTE